MSLLNKKRERKAEPLTIILGKRNEGYYYIKDSFKGGNKIKIPLMDTITKKDHIKIDIEDDLSESKKMNNQQFCKK